MEDVMKFITPRITMYLRSRSEIKLIDRNQKYLR